MSNTYGIISLIFGIVGLCCGWIIPFGGFIFPAVAVICGIIGIMKDDSNGMAIAGLVLGIISFVCVLLVGAVILAILLPFLGMGALI